MCRLAAERGHHVRALVRPATSFDPPPGVEVVRGEVLQDGVLAEAVGGCTAILSGLGLRRTAPWNPWSALASPPDLNARVATQLVQALSSAEGRRVVVISAAGVRESWAQVHPLLQWMIRYSQIGVAYQDLGRLEEALAASELDWMAVRPTTLTPGPPTGRGRIVGRYGVLSRIRRADVAAYMLDALEQSGPFPSRTPLLAGA